MSEQNKSKSTYKDVYLLEQQVCHILTSKQINTLMNKAYSSLIRLLQGNPKSVDDILIEYNKINEKKSNKTIYRNLNYLVKEHLVIVIGKRIISKPGEKILSHNLYTRSAKFFLNDGYIKFLKKFSNFQEKPLYIDEKEKMITFGNQSIDVLELGRILQQKFKIIHLFLTIALETEIDYNTFEDQISKVFLKKEENLIRLMKNIPVNKMNLFHDIDWLELNQLMESSLWIQVILEYPQLFTKMKFSK